MRRCKRRHSCSTAEHAVGVVCTISRIRECGCVDAASCQACAATNEFLISLGPIEDPTSIPNVGIVPCRHSSNAVDFTTCDGLFNACCVHCVVSTQIGETPGQAHASGSTFGTSQITVQPRHEVRLTNNLAVTAHTNKEQHTDRNEFIVMQ